ncbi:hypothetical protein [Paludibacterium denitrificans]|uniref:hypothetical protein n=1 Tax=Paludibacterium denitrificans TaxID=2675226 RepID=UPI001E38BA47|nr:hypothetical protein [Paludibacterium denitrificans]
MVLMLAVAQDSIVRALVILFFLGFLPTFLLAQLAAAPPAPSAKKNATNRLPALEVCQI